MARKKGLRLYRFRRLNHRDRRRAQQHRHAWVLALLVAISLLGLGGLGAFLGLSAFAAQEFTDYSRKIDELPELVAAATSPGNVFYDRNGAILHEFVAPDGQLHKPVSLASVSPALVDAIISTEDADFYDNPGINARGILRATYENFLPGSGPGFLQGRGGSSITQQLVKNLFFTYEERIDRSFSRKYQEVLLALAVNQEYSKDDVLEWYLNTLPLANQTVGVEAASQLYFGKPAEDLDLAEAALLAGIIQSPSRYDPFRNWEEAEGRRRDVLNLMVEHGVISPEEAEAAKERDLNAEYGLSGRQVDIASIADSPAPHFVLYAQQELEEILGQERVQQGGLRVTTSLDLPLHLQAQEIVRRWSAEFAETHDARNAALAGIDPATGEILIYVASRDYNDRSIEGENDILTSLQQPGSAFKIFTYLTAFWKGSELLSHFRPETPVADIPITPPLPGCADPEYAPNNADRSYRGIITVAQALSASRNVPAVRVIAEVGFEKVIDTARRMGLTTLRDPSFYGCSITVGGGDVKPLEMAYAAATVANNGLMKGRPSAELRPPSYRRLDPVAILRVEDVSGHVLYDYTEPAEEQVVPAYYPSLVNDILTLPTGTLPFSIEGQVVAAKTGTQEKEGDERLSLDTWTVGWSRHLAVAVWVGNTDNAPIARDAFSTNTAGKIFREVMEMALAGKPKLPFEPVEAPQEYVQSRKRGVEEVLALACNVPAEVLAAFVDEEEGLVAPTPGELAAPDEAAQLVLAFTCAFGLAEGTEGGEGATSAPTLETPPTPVSPVHGSGPATPSPIPTPQSTPPSCFYLDTC